MSKPMPPIPSKLAFDAIDSLETAPGSAGKTNLLKCLQGVRLTRNQARRNNTMTATRRGTFYFMEVKHERRIRQ